MIAPLFLSVLLLCANALRTQTQTVQADYEALVAAERGFAKAGRENGIRDSFVANLDDQSVVFTGDQFRPGKATYERVPDGSQRISWNPNYAEIAASGTFGFTTGPFDVRPGLNDAAPVAYGQFTSVWHKTTTGDWKVLIDFGCGHAKPVQAAPKLISPTQFARKATAVADTAVSNRELMQLEATFSQAARTQNLRDAYKAVLPASDSLRLLREGHERYEGAAAKRLAETSVQQVDYQPLRALTAPSGDLGYSYGYATFNGARQAFLRVWRKRSGRWQLAHEVLTVKLS
ncbi:hypothetical protein [Spirosoma koreense]